MRNERKKEASSLSVEGLLILKHYNNKAHLWGFMSVNNSDQSIQNVLLLWTRTNSKLFICNILHKPVPSALALLSGYGYLTTGTNLQYLVGCVCHVVIQESMVDHMPCALPVERQLQQLCLRLCLFFEALERWKLQHSVVPNSTKQVHLKQKKISILS